MHYVITGAAGKIARPLTSLLLKAGHTVTVIGRNEKNLEPLVRAGAKAAIGKVEDASFIEKAFAGADAVYTQVPNDIQAPDYKERHITVGNNFANAIASNNIQYVVNLSSIGAHLSAGAGPVSALHHYEKVLFNLKHVHILNLRPSYFFQNLFSMIPMIRHMGIMGSNFQLPNGRFPIAHTDDIAATAAEELLSLHFTGHNTRYVVSDETGTDEIAAAIGEAIGKPGLRWIKFSEEDVLENLIKAGFPYKSALSYAGMFTAIDKGLLTEQYWENRPAQLGKIKLKDFAQQFAAVYNQRQQPVLTQ